MTSFSNNSNIRLQSRLCNCGRTTAIYISNTPTPHCNYFKFLDEDDEDVMSRICSSTKAYDAITVKDFNDVRTRLDDMENDYGRRLERMENNIQAIVNCHYFIME
ncbi:hypothetical protein CsSME_00044335 [Camellia sinensis var. sinensis]